MIVERVRKFVEMECKKPSSKYGYEPYKYHFVSVHKYAKELCKRLGGDMEVVEIAAWMHDIGSIMVGRKEHHITGCRIAEKKLREFGLEEEKIKKVKDCIFSHRGSQKIDRESIEEEIIADADAMSNFDNLPGIFKAAYIYEKKEQGAARQSVKQKLINCWNKLSLEAKKIIKPKYESAIILLE